MNRAKGYLNEVGRKLSPMSTDTMIWAKGYLNEVGRKPPCNN